MKNKTQVILTVIFVICFFSYLFISSTKEDDMKRKWTKSLQVGTLVVDLDCKISSTYRNIYYNCNLNGKNIGTISFVELSKLTTQPINMSSQIKLEKTELKVFYSVDFQCVVNPFQGSPVSIASLVPMIEDSCFPHSKELLSILVK